MAQQIKITQTSNADMNIGVTKNMTAVEWLAEQMLHPESFNPYIEQAKAMEKEQMISFCSQYAFNLLNKHSQMDVPLSITEDVIAYLNNVYRVNKH